jgi:hypothetical protein
MDVISNFLKVTNHLLMLHQGLDPSHYLGIEKLEGV